MKWPIIIVATMLLVAIPSGFWPYNYYILLRWVVFILGLVLVSRFSEMGKTSYMYIYGAMAVLFNPILPFHLDKSLWVITDFVAAMLLLFLLKSKVNNYESIGTVDTRSFLPDEV